MKYEIDLFGVLVPTLLLWVIVAYVLSTVVRRLFNCVGLYRHVWHRALFDVSVYTCLLGGLVLIAKEYAP